MKDVRILPRPGLERVPRKHLVAAGGKALDPESAGRIGRRVLVQILTLTIAAVGYDGDDGVHGWILTAVDDRPGQRSSLGDHDLDRIAWGAGNMKLAGE